MGDSKNSFVLCRWSFVQLLYPGDPLWENFPQHLATQQGLRWYVNSFLAPFNEADLNIGEQHALRVCCLLAIPLPPPRAEDITLTMPPDLSQVSLPKLGKILENLASGMGRLAPYFMANRSIADSVLISHLKHVTGFLACPKCLRLRQRCDCAGIHFTASYNKLRTSPLAFTMLTLTVPHIVSSQASGLMAQGVPPMRSPLSTTWMPPSMAPLSTVDPDWTTSFPLQ